MNAGTQSAERLARRVAQAALDRKAQEVVVIDVRGRSSYTDFLVVASGTSDRHVQSIADHIADTSKTEGDAPMSSEGLKSGQWALIDFGDVVAHVFHHFTREVYNLEDLWREAPRLPVDDSSPPPPAPKAASGA